MRPLGLEMWNRPVTAMREAMIIAKKLFSGETVSFEGEVFKVKSTYLPAPPKTKIPIYLAARGPKLLELAGELADGCLLSVPGEYVGLAKEFVKKGAEKAGRRIEDIQMVNLSTFNPDPDKKRSIDAIRPSITHMITDSPTIVHEKLGIDLARVEAVREAMKNEGREKALSLITDDMVEKMTVVGSPRECAEKIERQFKAGLDQIVLNIPRNLIDEGLIKSTGRDIVQALRG
jgi:5,10-methylenetetrahydromethanopterin reductase